MKKVQTGDILSLRRSEAEIADREENEAIRVIVDEKKAGIFALALIFQPYQRIRVRDDGRVDSSDLVGKNSKFVQKHTVSCTNVQKKIPLTHLKLTTHKNRSEFCVDRGLRHTKYKNKTQNRRKIAKIEPK
jgi:hypothetical protein